MGLVVRSCWRYRRVIFGSLFMYPSFLGSQRFRVLPHTRWPHSYSARRLARVRCCSRRRSSSFSGVIDVLCRPARINRALRPREVWTGSHNREPASEAAAKRGGSTTLRYHDRLWGQPWPQRLSDERHELRQLSSALFIGAMWRLLYQPSLVTHHTHKASRAP